MERVLPSQENKNQKFDLICFCAKIPATYRKLTEKSHFLDLVVRPFKQNLAQLVSLWTFCCLFYLVDNQIGLSHLILLFFTEKFTVTATKPPEYIAYAVH